MKKKKEEAAHAKYLKSNILCYIVFISVISIMYTRYFLWSKTHLQDEKNRCKKLSASYSEKVERCKFHRYTWAQHVNKTHIHTKTNTIKSFKNVFWVGLKNIFCTVSFVRCGYKKIQLFDDSFFRFNVKC